VIVKGPISLSLRAGHTLLEMMLSLVLLSIVMASVGSAVMFAAQTVPNEDSAIGSLLSDTAVLSRIAEDIGMAKYVVEQTGTAVTVVVPDRTGDSLPDRIRYSWSGVRGDPLNYQLNDDAAFAVLTSVQTFGLSYETDTSTTTLPAVLQRTGSESVLWSKTTALPLGENISATTAVGQRFAPSGMSADTVAYEPTRVRFYGEQVASPDGVIPVTLREVDGYGPTGKTHASATLLERNMTAVADWNEIHFDEAGWVPKGELVILVFGNGTGSNTLATLYHRLSGTFFTYSIDGGTTWLRGWDGAMMLAIYGYEIAPSEEIEVTREHLTAIDATLQSVAADRSPLQRRIRMSLEPQQLDHFAEADFDADPTPMDLNGDGASEWAYDGVTIPDSALSDGHWTPAADLIYKNTRMSDADVITVSARLKANDTLGPVIQGPTTYDDAGDVLPIAAMLRTNGSSGQELVVYNDTTRAVEKLVIPDLPSGWVDVAITVFPEENIVAISIDRETIGSFEFQRTLDDGVLDATVRFGPGGGVGQFTDVSVRIGGEFSFMTGSDGASTVTQSVLDILGL
jgi:hypothetical protein